MLCPPARRSLGDFRKLLQHPRRGDDYGYRAFGVPGLGLAPDLGEHLVIAPYAAALALVVAPREACANLARLEQLGYLSSHGFYDAIDYTAELSRPGSPAQRRARS